MTKDDRGASGKPDRATRQSPSPSVSALRASIPSAEEVLAHGRLVAPDLELIAFAAAPGTPELRVGLGLTYEDKAWGARALAELERQIEAMPYNVTFLRARAEGRPNGERQLLLEYRFRPAQAIEARRAETGTGSVHESAVAEGYAPKGDRHD